MPQPGASLLSYPAAIPLSNCTLVRLADLIRAQRAQRRCRWRRLDPGRQALLVLAHLRNGDTYARLAAGFGIGGQPLLPEFALLARTGRRYADHDEYLLHQIGGPVHAR
ncbi:hypothetical protein Psi02_62490 [Planotetraspora silvatica]|uniref:Transposase Helix-turn-helix domain-containing protein n=1 Tax=Planotetraspora silvatica TaxID=234614 RepID=A0A8J3USA1_9ACTN|nr:hypothetical protein Psi02_62490 [Planotetraspora silvatica]